MKVSVPQLYWSEPSELELDFPDSWEVHFCPPRGHDRPRLTPEEMQRAFDSPIASPPLKEVARGRKEVAIIFDDFTRPTRVYQIASYVLKELAHRRHGHSPRPGGRHPRQHRHAGGPGGQRCAAGGP